jgi:hypothetical protein
MTEPSREEGERLLVIVGLGASLGAGAGARVTDRLIEPRADRRSLEVCSRRTGTGDETRGTRGAPRATHAAQRSSNVEMATYPDPLLDQQTSRPAEQRCAIQHRARTVTVLRSGCYAIELQSEADRGLTAPRPVRPEASPEVRRRHELDNWKREL